MTKIGYNSAMRQLYQLIRREQSYFEERIDMKDLYGGLRG